jgi:chorismate synthase
MLRYITSGESHGKSLVGIIEGLPAGLSINSDEINHQLYRRQQGYGRSERMKIEQDTAVILSGVRFGRTTGAPIAVEIKNKDWENWQKTLSVEPLSKNQLSEEITIPRPGHADLAGSIKYGHTDIRNVIERASARETGMRTALGAIARLFLKEFNIDIGSHVIKIHTIKSSAILNTADVTGESLRADKSPVRCLDPEAETEMVSAIDRAKSKGDTVGGRIEIVVSGLPVGLGSYIQWDCRLDGMLAGALMALPGIKAVEIGLGVECGRRFGSEVHDEIVLGSGNNITRTSNNAGGIEGGISNGQPLMITITMKPIATLLSALNSVDLKTKKAAKAHIERSDVCAVPAASVVGEAVAALVLTQAFLDKFSGDNIEDIKMAYNSRRTL